MDLNEGFDDLFDSINNLRTVSYEKGLKGNLIYVFF